MENLTAKYTPYIDLEKALHLHFKTSALEAFSSEHRTPRSVEKWRYLQSNETPPSILKKIGNEIGSFWYWLTSNTGPNIDINNVWKYCNDVYPTFRADVFDESYNEAEMNLSKYLRENAVTTEIQTDVKAKLKKRLYPDVKISVEKKLRKEVLVVKRPVLLLGMFLKDIEDKLARNTEIDEVHLVASEILYIDCHLRQEKWHGKNVVLVAKQVVVVVPDRLWDLSGNPGEELESAEHGTENGDIDGKDGIKGKAGESGGNLTLFADRLTQIDLLHVKLNGGKGGEGQNGGDGLAGKSGGNRTEFKALVEMISKLPSPAEKDSLESRSRNALRITLLQLKSLIVRSEVRWSVGIELDSGMKIGMELEWIGCHVKGYTKEGWLVEFGYFAKESVGKHAYCLISSGLGMPGGFGGFGGVGARGGFIGKMAVFNLKGNGGEKAERGDFKGMKGERGQDGMNGLNGNTGFGVGYVNRDTWSDEIFYNGLLELVNDPLNIDNAAWCPKIGKWRGIVETTTIEQPQPAKRVKRERPKDGEMEEAEERVPINNDQVRKEYVDEVVKVIAL